MANAGLTIFFRKVDASAWLSYKDYVRHISYGLIRANLPLLYTEGFQERILLQTPSALPLGVSSLGEPFFYSNERAIKNQSRGAAAILFFTRDARSSAQLQIGTLSISFSNA